MPSDTRIYVGNLPPDVREREVEDIFYRFGRIEQVDLKLKGPRPYAFVEFEDPRDAEDAVYDRDGYKFDGYRLRVEFTKGGGRRRRSPTPTRRRSDFRVLVSGLPDSASWQDLKDHMKYAGPIAYADVYSDNTGIVEYLYYEDMKYALRKLDDTKLRSHLGDSSYIRVDEAVRRNKRSRYGSTGGHSSGYHSSRRSRSRTPPRSRSRSRSYSRSRSRSASPARSRSPSMERSRSRSRTPNE